MTEVKAISRHTYAAHLDDGRVYLLSNKLGDGIPQNFWRMGDPNWEVLPMNIGGERIVPFGHDNRLPTNLRNIIDDNNLMRYAAINNDAIIVRGDTSEILKSPKREDTVVQLIEGDYLFLYSNNTRRMMSSDGNSPEDICKTLAAHHADEQQVAIDAITGSHPQTGDITIVGIGI